VSFAAVTLCVASQRAFIVVVVDFVMDSVRKLLDTPSHYAFVSWGCIRHMISCRPAKLHQEVRLCRVFNVGLDVEVTVAY
jgi:hypothetical protein